MITKKKKPERKGAWWRLYTKKFLDEPKPIPVKKPIKLQPRSPTPPQPHKKIIFPKFGSQDPFSQMEKIQKEMDKTFQNLFSRSFIRLPTFPRIVKLEKKVFRKPMVELRDLGKEFAVRAEMPGVKKEDIKVKVEGRNLILDARSQKKQEKKEEYLQSFSQSFTGFRNVIRLPAEVDKKSARAKYENGILTVILQKKESSERGDVEIE